MSHYLWLTATIKFSDCWLFGGILAVQRLRKYWLFLRRSLETAGAQIVDVKTNGRPLRATRGSSC
jgi:hypothetical protein